MIQTVLNILRFLCTLQPLNTTIEVYEGDNVDIYYIPTVPYFCSQWETTCENNVEIVIPDYQHGKCENGRAELVLVPKTSCGFKLLGILPSQNWMSRWNELKDTPLKLNVQAPVSPQYDDDLSMSIKAKVPFISHHGVWTYTTVPEVQVKLMYFSIPQF